MRLFRSKAMLLVEVGVLTSLGSSVIAFLGVLLAKRAGLTATQLSTVAALAGFVAFVTGIPAGALVDRSDRRRLAVLANSAGMALVACMVGIIASGRVSFWTLCAAEVGFSALAPLVFALERSMIRSLSDEGEGGRLSAALEMRGAVVAVFGATLAGALYTAQPLACLLIPLSGYVLLLLVTLTLPRTRLRPLSDAAPGRSIGRFAAECVEGVRLVRDLRFLRMCLVLFTILNLLSFVQVFSLAILARHSPMVSGLAFACYGLGAVLGAKMASRYVERLRPARPLAWCAAVMGAAPVVLCRAPVLVSTYTVAFVFGLGASVIRVVVSTYRFYAVAESAQARVAGVFFALAAVTGPVGALVSSAIYDRAGLSCALLWYGAVAWSALVCFADPSIRRLTPAALTFDRIEG